VPAAAVPSKRKRSISNGRLLDVSGFRPSVIPKCRCGPAAWLESQKIAVPAATRYVASMFAGLADATQSRERFEQLAREHATPGGIKRGVLDALKQRRDLRGRQPRPATVLYQLNTT
jgi:hypothetical protein